MSLHNLSSSLESEHEKVENTQQPTGRPFVSAIVCFRDEEQYLDECLRSLMNQSYSNFEVIMVDDGSTDFSNKIASYYRERDSRFKLVTSFPHSLGHARNKGMSLATGRHILFLDADDFLENRTFIVLKMVSLTANPELISFNSVPVLEGNSNHSLKSRDNPARRLERRRVLPFLLTGQISVYWLFANDSYSHSSCMYLAKTSLYERLSLKFQEGILHEDIEFTFKALMGSRLTFHLSSRLHRRRVRRDSITGSPNKRNLKDLDGVLERLKNPPAAPSGKFWTWNLARLISQVARYRNGLEKKLSSSV